MTSTLHYFAVGGTGALSVEPLLHMCAAGIGPKRIGIILIDADAGSPALKRARELIQLYCNVRTAFGNPDIGFFSTELIRTSRQESFWTPLSAGMPTATGAVQDMSRMALETFVDFSRMTGESEDARHLFDLLFSDEQRIELLQEGFRGNPAIGSILMHSFARSTLCRELMASAKNDPSSRFFAAGSIFGGTGASALPVIAQVLANAGIEEHRLGAALITPYYALGVPSREEDQDGRLKPDSARFLRAAAAALPTYTRGQTRYGRMYVIGDEHSLPRARKVYSAGGSSQKNDPHFVELFAALAALDFARLPSTTDSSGMVYTTVQGQEPSWVDLHAEGRKELPSFMIGLNFFLQYFKAQRNATEEQVLQADLAKVPWMNQVGLDPSFVRTNSKELNDLGKYAEAVWAYLWAAGSNFLPLRLAAFDSLSSQSVPVPDDYASHEERSFKLPRIEASLHGYNRKKKGGFFSFGDEARLSDRPTEMFAHFSESPRANIHGLPALMHYLRSGSQHFVDRWFSAAATPSSGAGAS